MRRNRADRLFFKERRNRRILITMEVYDVIYVDDEDTLTSLFNRLSQTIYPGKRVRTYTDIGDLLDDLRNRRVVARNWLVDIMMRKMDINGYQIAEEVRKKYGNKVRVYYYTALNEAAVKTNPSVKYANGVFYKCQDTPMDVLERIFR